MSLKKRLQRSSLRKIISRWTCLVAWMIALYFLWIAPSSLLNTRLMSYGLLGPLRGYSEGELWWLDYWLGEEVGLRIDPVALAITSVPTVGLKWFALCMYQSLAHDRTLTLLFWRTRGERRWRRGQCPKCGYDLKGRLRLGCPECGWRRRQDRLLGTKGRKE